MAELVLINKSDMVAIADAIRSKTGIASGMNVTEMIENISNISGENEINKDETNIPKDAIIIDNMELDFTETTFLQVTSPSKYPFIMGKSYSVQWNNVTYTTQCVPGASIFPCAIGNLKFLGLLFGEDEAVDMPDTGEPFLLMFMYGIIFAVSVDYEHVFTTIRAIDDGIDYIYEIPETIIYPIEYDEELNSSMYMELNNSNNFINIILENNLYKVTLNGVDYEVTGTKQIVNMDGLPGTFMCLGNPFYISPDMFEDNGDPFLIVAMDGMIMAVFSGLNESYTISIEHLGKNNSSVISPEETIKQLIDGTITTLNSDTNNNFPQTRFAYHDKLESVILPNIKNISEWCFINCFNLSTVVIPSAEIIGDRAFYNCTNLKFIALPSAVSINGSAFSNCTNLTNFEAGGIKQLLSIGNSAFSDCTKLSSIFGIETVLSIEAGAFSGCSALRDININSASTIGWSAFEGCSSLRDININGNIITTLGSDAFKNCTSLQTNMYIPEVNKIDTGTFQNCTSLPSVYAPGATIIGQQAFENCTSLSNIYIPNVTKIEYSAFKNCTSLQTLDLPKLTNLDSSDYCFSGCTSLKAVIFRGNDVVSAVACPNAFENTPISNGNGYIYVKSSLLDSYATRLPWKNYASQLRALENYTIDGTVTGQLDPNKI